MPCLTDHGGHQVFERRVCRGTSWRCCWCAQNTAGGCHDGGISTAACKVSETLDEILTFFPRDVPSLLWLWDGHSPDFLLALSLDEGNTSQTSQPPATSAVDAFRAPQVVPPSATPQPPSVEQHWAHELDEEAQLQLALAASREDAAISNSTRCEKYHGKCVLGWKSVVNVVAVAAVAQPATVAVAVPPSSGSNPRPTQKDRPPVRAGVGRVYQDQAATLRAAVRRGANC
jgi:hypothetical protein